MGHLSAVVAAPRSPALAARPIASTSVTAPPPCLPPSTSSTAPWSAAACPATPTRSSSSSSTPSSALSGLAGLSMPSPTTTPPTSIPRSSGGSPIPRAGSSISPQRQHPGSTPSKASSQSSPADKSDVASSNLSPTSKTPSAATSETQPNPKNHPLGQHTP